jgi:light-regulated signal transduction histidine kinase (bacteriophytochrome)
LSDVEIDLSNCDREPIHQLGAIQPIGFLIAATPDWMIARASANVVEYVGRSADDLIGLPMSEIFDQQASHDLRNRLMLLQTPEPSSVSSISLCSRASRIPVSTVRFTSRVTTSSSKLREI